MANNVGGAVAASGGDMAEYIKIKVVGQDGNEAHFRVKLGTSMAKLRKSYAVRTGVSAESLRFLFDGRRIEDQDTPESLEMKDGDYQHTIMADNNGAAFATSGGDIAKYMKVIVIGQDGNEIHFRAKLGTSMGKLKKAYADRTKVSAESLRFLFDGSRIEDEDTLESLEMEDGDIINVYQHKTGR
ncbi:hypothetical protein B9Z55_027559 [Caenorhabditis nigoni]|uniref:Ubiquitin-like domain-containing protein n=1 Tax=Caenorhabditis nigoni TaxID=1611254 RepID=A0A2G5SFL2_9PELO|nr:hypothetical protein B9Z55_027559 [Caenorhabditis nigoni]